MRTLTDTQKKFLRIYDNLTLDANNFVTTAEEPENFARGLLDGFMQNDTFKGALRTIASDFGRQDIIKTIDEYQPTTQNRNEIADSLVAAVERNDDAMLVDLIKTPENPTYSLSELNSFWNIAANIQNTNPEVYTHLVADKRYLGMFEQTIAANEYDPQSVERLRAEVTKAHTDASTMLDTIEYDMFQMEYHGASNNIYDLVEASNLEPLGQELTATAEKTIFTGLEVTQPMPAEQLTAVVVPVEEYYAEIQAVKDAEAARVEAEANKPVVVSTVPDMRRNFDQAATASVTTPEVATPTPVEEAKPEPKSYTVKQGDNLWNIARTEYGLTSYKDIMRAVDHIANTNGLNQGVQANHINVGQQLTIPTADDVKGPVTRLDWVALDRDTRGIAQPVAHAF